VQDHDLRPQSPTPRSASPVMTAVIAAVATIVCCVLQFVVAPLVSSRTQRVVVAAAVLPQPAPTARATIGLAAALPESPSQVAIIDPAIPAALRGRPLTASDLTALNCHQLRVLRNIPPALHGHRFNDPVLARLFNAQPWYRPADNETPLPNVEYANVLLIQQAERICVP